MIRSAMGCPLRHEAGQVVISSTKGRRRNIDECDVCGLREHDVLWFVDLWLAPEKTCLGCHGAICSFPLGHAAQVVGEWAVGAHV